MEESPVSIEVARNAKRAGEAARSRNASGGGGPTDNDMEKRVAALEKSFEKIDGKLDKLGDQGHALEVKLATIDGKMESKATAEKVGAIEGRISDLPSKWFVATTAIAILFGASALTSAVLVYLEKIRAALGVH